MRFPDLYRSRRPAVSFELFPPRTDDGLRALEERLPRLIALEPAFMTVTYGAMGSSRERTLEIASRLRNEYGQEVAHHLTCVGSDGAQINDILEQIEAAGIRNIVALRGDPPRGQDQFQVTAGGYAHALQLVEHIRSRGDFGVAVAGYPEKHLEAETFEADLQRLKEKVDAGADVVITQLFYDNRHFHEFVGRCRRIGITVPVIPGLLPIMDVQQIQRITRMCGSSLPADLLASLEAARDPEEVIRIGIDHTVAQLRGLLEEGVEGVHFYVLNHYRHISEIMAELKRMMGAAPSSGGASGNS